MRLRLEDQGEGWFWESAWTDAEVVEERQEHSRRFYRLAFSVPAETEGPPGRSSEVSEGPGGPIRYAGAWLSPRWVGHEIDHQGDIAALVWLISGLEHEAGPPRDVDFSARVRCREIRSTGEPAR